MLENIMLFCEKTNSFLAINLEEKIHNFKEKYPLSSVSVSSPINRCTFVFEKFNLILKINFF
jgi:hypothetical protein